MTRKAKSPAKTESKAVAKPKRERTDDEQAILTRFMEKREKAPKGRVKLNGDAISFDHPDNSVGQVQLMESLGITSFDFLDGLLHQVANAGSQKGYETERGMNFMLSVIKGIEPRDQVEVMLGAQMAAVHMATMTFCRRLAYVDNLPQQESAEKALNKLMRTFTTQMEALRKYRSGGEQKVTVEHVHVHAGGQAVVGTINHGGNTDGKDGGHGEN